MKKGDKIHGYTIVDDIKVAGGMSVVSFAEKGGKVYFIKEFISPKYPTKDSPGSDKTKDQKRKACDEFERHHNDLRRAIATRCAGEGGNLIYDIDFFREGASYYKVTEKVDISSLSMHEISKLPLEQIITVARSVCHSLGILHDLKIVHGDLKPDNLLLKKVPSGYSAKLIDFDDSYFERKPPKEKEELVGTPEYYSPEQAEYVMDEDGEVDGNILTCKSDIFSLGVIFSEYFTGSKPVLPIGYDATWRAVSDGKKLAFNGSLDTRIERLIKDMLSVDPSKRPNIKTVKERLKAIKEGCPVPPPPTIVTPSHERSSSLKGKAIEALKKYDKYHK